MINNILKTKLNSIKTAFGILLWFLPFGSTASMSHSYWYCILASFQSITDIKGRHRVSINRLTTLHCNFNKITVSHWILHAKKKKSHKLPFNPQYCMNKHASLRKLHQIFNASMSENLVVSSTRTCDKDFSPSPHKIIPPNFW